MNPKLSVNLDHVLTLRQVRQTLYPSIVEAARLVELSQACGVTLHLREDRRHVQDPDVFSVQAAMRKKLNLEMSIASDVVAVCLRLKPQQATLVPERRAELTTEGGLNLSENSETIRQVLTQLKAAGIVVSLFIEPSLLVVEQSRSLGADMVELHTGAFAHATALGRDGADELLRLRRAAEHAHGLGLQVAAGHGLTLQNVAAVAQLPYITELNIGHGLVSHAVFVGLPQAIADFLQAMQQSTEHSVQNVPALSLS